LEDAVSRDAVPAEVVRAVLVEAGHRCAIPTCRSTTTEIAHIVPWAESHDHSFENLIALCPTCHTRYDQKKEIDRKSIRMYKRNLGLLNGRYGDLERRVFDVAAATGEGKFILGAGGDLQMANAAKDGLVVVEASHAYGLDVTWPDGQKRNYPMTFTCYFTHAGLEFVKHYTRGDELA